MGNQNLCNCNKVNNLDELETVDGTKQVKSVSVFVAQKVEDWTLNGKINEEIKTSDRSSQMSVINKIRNERLSEFYQKNEDMNITPTRNYINKFGNVDAGDPQNNFEITKSKHNNYDNHNVNSEENFFDNYETTLQDDDLFVNNKPKFNKKKKSVLCESNYQVENYNEKDTNRNTTECSINKNEEIEKTSKVENNQNNDKDDNNNKIRSNLKNKIFKKKKHFNRSGELIYYRTYDDNLQESKESVKTLKEEIKPIVDYKIKENFQDSFEPFEEKEKKQTNPQTSEKKIESNTIVNEPKDNMIEEVSLPTPRPVPINTIKNNYYSSDLSLYLTDKNKLYQKKKYTSYTNNSQNLNDTKNKLAKTSDPIYIQTESNKDPEEVIDSIDSLLLTEPKLNQGKSSIKLSR